MEVLIIITSILIFIFVSLIIWINQQYTFWNDLGVETMKPVFFFGNLKDVFATQKMHISEFTRTTYNYIKSKNLKYGGCYFLFLPMFFPVDPDLIKRIIVKDFDHFVDRGAYYDEENDPLTAHLFNLEGKKWKNLRAKLSPTFTSGKLKMMFPTIIDCSRNLEMEMDKLCKSKEPVDTKDILARFNTDVIASVAFGLDTNSVSNPHAEFHKKSEKIFSPSFVYRVSQILMFCAPAIARIFKLRMLPPDVNDFYFNLIRDTVNYREQNNVFRKDFMHLLIQLKNRGAVDDSENIARSTASKNEERLSFNELAAQAFSFFLAGFETSSIAETFCLYELAANSDIQQKVRDEIEEVLRKYDGEITYDAIMEMNYLEKVINETLRKYPPFPSVPRICTKSYKIPDSDLTLKPGTKVFIPLIALHYDEEYYPNPQVFDPERFSEENKRKRHPFVYLPFGEGPRICIGMRFALLQTKIGIASLIKNYRVSVNPKTKQPIKFDPNTFVLSIKGGMWLDFEKVIK